MPDTTLPNYQMFIAQINKELMKITPLPTSPLSLIRFIDILKVIFTSKKNVSINDSETSIDVDKKNFTACLNVINKKLKPDDLNTKLTISISIKPRTISSVIRKKSNVAVIHVILKENMPGTDIWRQALYTFDEPELHYQAEHLPKLIDIFKYALSVFYIQPETQQHADILKELTDDSLSFVSSSSDLSSSMSWDSSTSSSDICTPSRPFRPI